MYYIYMHDLDWFGAAWKHALISIHHPYIIHVFPFPPPGGSGGPKPSFMAAVEAAWSMEYL